MHHTRTIDVHIDWLVMILRLQIEQLGHNQAGVLICHLLTQSHILILLFMIISKLTGPIKQTIRSLKSREKMSYARSPLPCMKSHVIFML